MNKRRWLLGIAAALILAGQSAVLAGECVDGEESYLARLEGGPGSDGFDYALSCLADNPIVEGRLWAGPIAAATFAALRADTLQARLAKAVSSLANTAWADSSEHRQLLFRILARRGISKLDSVEVLPQLLGPGKQFYFNVYEDLAILGDCRAVPQLRVRYAELRVAPERGYSEEILDLLSCLYHIPCAEAVETARQLYAQERDEKLRARLARVVDRK